MPVIDRLHQQRPVILAKVVKVLEGTMRHMPMTIMMANQTAVYIVFHR